MLCCENLKSTYINNWTDVFTGPIELDYSNFQNSNVMLLIFLGFIVLDWNL